MAAITFFQDLIKPTGYKEPPPVNVDPTQNQLDTVSGNAATFDSAKGLAQNLNDFMAQEVARRLKASFPEFDQLQTSGAQDIADLLAGKLSDSESARRQRSSAATALGMGTNVAGTTLRDLGIGQQQARAQGLNALGGFTNTVLGAKAAPLFDFSSSFLTPQQRWQQTYTNKSNAWYVQNAKNQMAAQPPGWETALAVGGDQLATMVADYYSYGALSRSSSAKENSGGSSGFNMGNYFQQQNQGAESGGWNSSNFNTGDAQALAMYGMY